MKINFKKLDSRQVHVFDFLLRMAIFNALVIVAFTLRLFMNEFERMDLREFIFVNSSVIANVFINVGLVSFFLFLALNKASVRRFYRVSLLSFSVLTFLFYVDTLVFKKLSFHLFTVFYYDIDFIMSSVEALWKEFALYSSIAFLLIPLAEMFFSRISMPFWGKTNILKRGLSTKGKLGVLAFLLVLFVAEKAVFAYALRYNIRTIKRYAYSVPFYQRLGIHWVVEQKNETIVEVDEAVANVNYPKEFPYWNGDTPFNLIWIVMEGLGNTERKAAAMPELEEIAKSCIDFKAHYLCGDKSEDNLFSMYYGLYPPYFSSFYKDSKTPIWLDLLRQEGYELKAFLPNKIGFSELKRLVFFEIEQPHNSQDKLRANTNIVQYFKSWQLTRETNKPFAAFLHFDLAKVPFEFETPQYTPYKKVPNFVRPNDSDTLVHNGHKNAVAFQAKTLYEIWHFVKQNIWSKRTIIVISSDGAETGSTAKAKGRYPNYQVPLLMYIPGLKAFEIQEATQQTDVLPTVLKLMGFKFDNEDISNGQNALEYNNERLFAFWFKDSLTIKDAKGLNGEIQLTDEESLKWLEEELTRFRN